MLRFIVHQLNGHPVDEHDEILRNYLDNHISSDNNRKKMVFSCFNFFRVLVKLFRFEYMSSSNFFSISMLYSWTSVTMAVSIFKTWFRCY